MNKWKGAKENVPRSIVWLNLIRTASLLHLGASRHCFVLPLSGSSQGPVSVALGLGAKYC